MTTLTRRALVAGGIVAAGAAVGAALTAAGRRFGLCHPTRAECMVLARPSRTPRIACSSGTRWRANFRPA